MNIKDIGPTICSPYLRRLESLTICKGSVLFDDRDQAGNTLDCKHNWMV